MASAAAVAADAARSPLPDGTPDDEQGTSGFIRPRDDIDDDLPGENGLNSSAQSDDEAGGDGGLFGSDDDDDDIVPRKRRQLDDEDLDSGDDIDRDDRLEREESEEQRQIRVLDIELARHPIPQPSDGELYLMKVPRFLAIEPAVFRPDTFTVPETDHDSNDEPSTTFSPYQTAMSTIRWRFSPNNPTKLESNARVLRWSNGSLTLQLATDPKTQYMMPANSLAPPQINPRKPTPTSVKERKGRAAARSTKYDPEQDSFTYLGTPQAAAGVIRVTNKITAGLSVVPVTETTDDALERLQNSLAAAVRGNNLNTADGGIGMISITEDPELAKKKAEVAEKEKLKAQRRREAQEVREREKGTRLPGSGRRSYGGGLTVGGLEDDDELGGPTISRPYGSSGASRRRKAPRPNRRGEIYSDEEEQFGRRIKTKEDEYDEEDDFVARSDEEEEVVDDDEDTDEGIGEHYSRDRGRDESDADGDADDTDAAPARRPTSPKREAEADPVGGDSPVARTKRRRVVTDDDDDE